MTTNDYTANFGTPKIYDPYNSPDQYEREIIVLKSRQEIVQELLDTVNKRAVAGKTIIRQLKVLMLVNAGTPLLIAIAIAEREYQERKRIKHNQRNKDNDEIMVGAVYFKPYKNGAGKSIWYRGEATGYEIISGNVSGVVRVTEFKVTRYSYECRHIKTHTKMILGLGFGRQYLSFGKFKISESQSETMDEEIKFLSTKILIRNIDDFDIKNLMNG